MKKKILIVLLFCIISPICFAKAQYYKTKNGYTGYAEMHYQGKVGEWTVAQINNNLFTISNAFGFMPYKRDKLSNAEWELFWAAYYDQYDVKKNEIYNITIKLSGDMQVLHMTFYYDGEYIQWLGFIDYSQFPV